MKIDYEAEVKIINPYANCEAYYIFHVPIKYYIEDSSTGQRISNREFEPTEAWESAYNNLIEQGKITE